MKDEIRQEAQPSIDTAATRVAVARETLLARVLSLYEGLYREHMPALIEEIHGMADGAKLPYSYAFFAATRDCMRLDDHIAIGNPCVAGFKAYSLAG